MLLARLVETTDALGATRARSTKRAAVADLLRAAEPGEAAALVGLLLGRPRQGRIGLGWRSLVSARDSTPSANSPALTITGVDDVLTRYGTTTGPGSAAARTALLRELFAAATDGEQDLLVRSLGGEVRTGALEGVVTDALAVAVERPLTEVRRAVMLSGDLGRTVELGLRDPAALADVRLQVGVPVQPMLASPGEDVESALAAAGEASVEHKLDGARIQVHRDGDDVLVVTRTLADVTSRVPEIVEVVRSLNVQQVVLDGETLMLAEDGAPRPFQDTMSRFGAAGRSDLLAPRFFDLLHLDGRDLLDEPLRTRRRLLAEVAPGLVIDGEVTADPQVARRVQSAALSAGHEGVVVKSLDSSYAAGRRGRAWLKVKPVHTYDLVVLGVEWGSGRRTGWLSNLHLGARDPEGRHGEPGDFVMVGKTFKGLTDELLRWQTEHLTEHEVRRTASTLHLRPEVVVEIAVDGVQRSARYPGGVALRFARVKTYRPDKRPDEADTVDSLRALLAP